MSALSNCHPHLLLGRARDLLALEAILHSMEYANFHGWHSNPSLCPTRQTERVGPLGDCHSAISFRLPRLPGLVAWLQLMRHEDLRRLPGLMSSEGPLL